MSKHKRMIIDQIKKLKMQIIGIIFLTIIAAIFELSNPYLTQKIIDLGILHKDFQFVVLLICLIIVLYIMLSVMNSCINLMFAKASVEVITNLKKDIITRLLRFPVSFFDKNKTGYVISRVEEIDTLNALFSPVLMVFLKSVISFIGAFFVILAIRWELLLFALVCLPVLFFITRYTSKQVLNTSKELNESAAEVQGEIHEDIAGLSEMKNFNLEEHKESEIKKYFSVIAKKLMRRNVFTVVGNEANSLFALISRSMFIILISYYIINGELTVGSYFSLLSYISNLFTPVQMFSSISLSIQPAIAVLSRMSFFMDNEIEEGSKGTVLINNINTIQFKKVYFSYPDNEREVLRDINIELSEGKNLFVYGPNGSGKSTIVKLLLGFYTNYGGEILVNGYNLKDININDLRRKIGIVSQKIYLFSGSIMDNIKQWDGGITDEEVYRVLEEYGLSSVLKDESYHHIGESGKNLSGGQMQEIALSRAVLRRPSLFIFDEPTSNLDIQKKEKFVQLLNKLKNNLCIIITHDDYLMSKMDREQDILLDISDPELLRKRNEVCQI
ncbi:ABC transporter ATP-binding protein [Paenibacillus lautus]|uniref:ABC transporter ATP-binding protein n=1 Tax=Paenibacillus lautus TaxID=1401 RepID=UPI001C7E0587|nr:ABC transporter ATP-binding protein [Paenibacillus lautus]MBX4151099.1 ABC transporter ATP-binding protein/permease [Paenibacillus lautus]